MVTYQFPFPAFAQFGDTVDGADEDAEGGEGESEEERFKGPAGAEFGVRRVERLLASQRPHPRDRSHCKVQRKTDKEEEREDLEREARNEDMVAEIRRFVLVAGSGGDTAAGGLQEKGDNVAGDEDTRVGEGGDAGVLRAEGCDDAGEGEVESCG